MKFVERNDGVIEIGVDLLYRYKWFVENEYKKLKEYLDIHDRSTEGKGKHIKDFYDSEDYKEFIELLRKYEPEGAGPQLLKMREKQNKHMNHLQI